MQTTTHYSLSKAEGTDTVNLLTQCYPNFDTIDSAMFNNKQASIGTATEVTTGTLHAITRNNTDSDVFRFTATSAWTAGDTMTVDGVGVSVHLADGTTPSTGAYIIGAEVFGIINGTLVTLYLTSTIQTYVKTFNSRSGDVTPTTSDYDASMIDYDNTSSGLTATDAQSAIDELKTDISTVSSGLVKYADTGSITLTITSHTATANLASILGIAGNRIISIMTIGASGWGYYGFSYTYYPANGSIIFETSGNASTASVNLRVAYI